MEDREKLDQQIRSRLTTSIAALAIRYPYPEIKELVETFSDGVNSEIIYLYPTELALKLRVHPNTGADGAIVAVPPDYEQTEVDDIERDKALLSIVVDAVTISWGANMLDLKKAETYKESLLLLVDRSTH